MEKLKRHPLYMKADALKRAFVLNGFTLYDNGMNSELEPTDVSLEVFRAPAEITAEQMLLEDGSYALRSRLLPAQLTSFKKTLPMTAITMGRIYDGRDNQHPAHLVMEGVIADKDLPMRDFEKIWSNLAIELYGIEASVILEPAEKGAYKIVINKNTDDSVVLGYTGPATWIAKALLGAEDPDVKTWIFSIDIDSLAICDFGLKNRAALYNNTLSYLNDYDDSASSYGDNFESKVSNILRKMGYVEFCGDKIYTADAYIRMNMIQEAWDKNNVGVELVKPLKEYSNPLTPLRERGGLPTVLAPALQQAMSENFASGEKEAKIFEIGHIFLPSKTDGAPIEKISVSFGAYGPNMNLREFRADVDRFLNELGIKNHFFIPTDMAIAYKTDECLLILDEKPTYLEGNCGHISYKALENFKINSEGFMAQLELAPLKVKAAKEYNFIPPEFT